MPIVIAWNTVIVRIDAIEHCDAKRRLREHAIGAGHIRRARRDSRVRRFRIGEEHQAAHRAVDVVHRRETQHARLRLLPVDALQRHLRARWAKATAIAANEAARVFLDHVFDAQQLRIIAQSKHRTQRAVHVNQLTIRTRSEEADRRVIQEKLTAIVRARALLARAKFTQAPQHVPARDRANACFVARVFAIDRRRRWQFFAPRLAKLRSLRQTEHRRRQHRVRAKQAAHHRRTIALTQNARSFGDVQIAVVGGQRREMGIRNQRRLIELDDKVSRPRTGPRIPGG